MFYQLDDIVFQVESAIKPHIALMRQHFVIGMHIRHGIPGKIDPPRHKLKDVEWFFECAKSLRASDKYNLTRKYAWFVTTDNNNAMEVRFFIAFDSSFFEVTDKST